MATIAPNKRALYWRVPRIWYASRCFILGGGPSLRDFDFERLRGERVIAVNAAFMEADFFDVCYFGDSGFGRKFKNELLAWPGLKVTTHQGLLGVPGFRVVRKKNGPMGLSTDSNTICWNKSSGATAINLAYLLGSRKIYLLGFDMKKVDGRINYHDHYDKPKNPNHDPCGRHLKAFPPIARDAQRFGLGIINATPGSAIDCFPRVDLKEVLP